MKRIRVLSALALALAGTARADFTPIPLNTASFNHDVVVEAVAARSLSDAVTATLDQGTNKGGATLYERGYNPAAPTTGMPVAGSLVTNAALNHIFRMPPDYHANNVVMVGHHNGGRSPVVASGTLTLITPAPFSRLSFLNSAGNGPVQIGYVVHYADSTTESNVFISLDWFNAAVNVFNAAGRVSLAGGVQNVGVNPAGAFFATDVVLANSAVNITSVDFYYTGSGTGVNLNNTNSNGRAVILAISGSTNNVNYNPLTVTGYNQDVVVEADGPQTTGTGVASAGTLTNNITVTMDGGVSKANNTWYERGYYAAFPESGIPAAGASVTSVWCSARYTMPGSYVGNCAAVICSNVTSANISFAAPTTVGALSFLCGAANGDTFVPCVVRFADGTTETNTIFVPDWFNRELPWAYLSHGRVLPSNRSVNQTPDQFYDPIAAPFPFAGDFRFGLPAPRLFDAVINVTNTASGVTNVSLSFTNGASSTRVVSIFAVSGAASGNVPPIFGARGTPTPGMPNNAPINAVSQLKQWAGTNNVVLSVTNMAGTSPLSYQWMKAPRGGGLRDKLYTFDYSTFANVVDGGRISGANTGALVISNALTSESADYLVVVTNPYGAATSTVATLMILTTNASVLVGAPAGDTIASYTGEGAGAGESVDHVIDRVAQKWSSFGLQQGGVNTGILPFVGPVGFRVTPLSGASIVTALRFFTANDNQGRDPVDYTLEGSNDGTIWSPITGGKLLGTLSLPTGRNGTGATPINPLNQNVVEVNFANATAYKSFRVSITNVADYRAIPLMQIAEVDMLGAFLSGIFNVTGGGIACIGEGGVAVGLSGSQTSVTYFLLNNSVFAGVSVEGTGAAISFGNQTNGGMYSVLASNMTTAIVGPMNGSALVTAGTPPAIISGPTPGSATNYQGGMLAFSVAAVGSGVTYQWQRDGTNLINAWRVSGVNSANLVISPSDLTDNADAGHGYSCVVSGVCGIPVVSSEAMATVLPFVIVDTNLNPGANIGVYSLAMQADGKILTGGGFTALAGQTRNCIGRLNADGTLDNGFNPGASGLSGNYVYSLAAQADGKILVGGHFSTVGGQPRSRIARLNADGSLDTLFNPAANDVVFSLAPQPDGKIVVGGQFTTLAGQTRTYIGRLNANGSLDGAFDPEANGRVYTIALQTDGKILLGGDFGAVTGQPRNRIARLNANGTIDNTFNPGGDYSVLALAVQADGKILVGGGFTNLDGQTRRGIARLNPDGSLDPTFNPGANGSVQSLTLQTDGKILVGGQFTTLGGIACYRIGRLFAGGSIDSAFNPGAADTVFSVALQADGNILVGGQFSTLGGQARNCIARLNNPDSATQSLAYDGSTITWLRGGASPEVWRMTFEAMTNGVDFFSLGTGERIGSGWQLAVASLPAQTTLRASGFVTGCRGNSSAWFVNEVSLVSGGNNPPALANSIPDTNGIYGTPLSFEFTANTFSDPDAGQTLSYSAAGLPNGISFTPATRTFSGTPTTVGTNSITVTATDNGSPELSTNDVFDIVIAKAPLTATADNKSRTYAETNPPLTFSYSAFVLGETAAVLDTPPSISTSATNGSPVGHHPIILGGGADDHYELSYVSGTLNITPGSLIVTANNANRTYGALNPGFTGGITGLANGDNITATFASAAQTNSPIGVYPIVPVLVDPETRLSNYTVTTNAGTLSIAAAPLTVTAYDTNRVYGTTNPPLTGSLAGVVNDDSITATFVTSATFVDPPGNYPITPVLSDPDARLGNYSVTTNSGILTIISPPALSITTGDSGVITLSWPASYSSFLPEYAESLSPPVIWHEITSGTTESGGIKSFTATNDPNLPGRLYRLRLY